MSNTFSTLVHILPLVLFSNHSAVKEDKGFSAVELAYDSTLWFPSELLFQESPTALLDSFPYVEKMEAVLDVSPTPLWHTYTWLAYVSWDLCSANYVFISVDAVQWPLQPHEGPFKMVTLTSKHVTIECRGKTKGISIDHLKAAYLDSFTDMVVPHLTFNYLYPLPCFSFPQVPLFAWPALPTFPTDRYPTTSPANFMSVAYCPSGLFITTTYPSTPLKPPLESSVLATPSLAAASARIWLGISYLLCCWLKGCLIQPLFFLCWIDFSYGPCGIVQEIYHLPEHLTLYIKKYLWCLYLTISLY